MVHFKCIQSRTSILSQYNWEKTNALSPQAHSIWLQVGFCGLMPARTFPFAEGNPKLPIEKQCKGLRDPPLHSPKWGNLVLITRSLLPRSQHF